MQLQHIDIDRLHVSSLNMRHSKREPDVSDILPSVKARGILQPLLVRPNADGFEIVAGVDDVGDIPLFPFPVVSGRVVDAESGAPIKRFTVIDGHSSDDGQFQPLSQMEGVENEKGEFKRTITGLIISTRHQTEFVVKIAAVGYATQVTPALAAGKTGGPIVVRMKRAAPFRATVQTDDGKPASGARVSFVGAGNSAMVTGAALYGGFTNSPDEETVADGEGTFELPAPEESGRLLVLHDGGYAVVSTAEFKPDQRITLIRWARIEGTYRPGGKARASVQVYAEAIRPRETVQSGDRLSFSLNSTTDATGRFVIEHVPAMELRIGASAGFGYSALKTARIDSAMRAASGAVRGSAMVF